MIVTLTLCLFEAATLRLLTWAEMPLSQRISEGVASLGSLRLCRALPSCSGGADGVGEPIFPPLSSPSQSSAFPDQGF